MMVGDTTLGESGEGFTNGRKRVLLASANASVRKSSASIIVCIYIWIEKITSGCQLKMGVKERQLRLHPREEVCFNSFSCIIIFLTKFSYNIQYILRSTILLGEYLAKNICTQKTRIQSISNS